MLYNEYVFYFDEVIILENFLKRVAAIHDLSGIGRCSLSVILPTLSVMGIQVVPVPTAILSAHTGGFGEIELRDLTEYISPALEHYKRLGEKFDCVYSGFLASTDQIDHCLEFFSSYKNSLKVVDTVMGDNGKPYKTCTEALRRRMAELVAVADIITPNVTEAKMLLGENPDIFPMTTSEAKSRLVRLAEKGPDIVVITGADMADGTKCNIGFDKRNSSFWKVPFSYVPVNYPGTGDIFASVLVGAILQGDSLPIAISRATDFLEFTIKTTYSFGTEARYGVMLERTLHRLAENKDAEGFEPL